VTTSIPTVNSSSGGDTYQNLFTKLNEAITALNENAITVDPSSNGSVSTGNGYVDGILGVANLQVGALGGGNVQSSANLQIVTNTIFSSSVLINLGSLTFTTGLLKVGANVQFSNTGWLIGNSTVNITSNSSTLSISGTATINSLGFFLGSTTISNNQVTTSTGQFDTLNANVVQANSFQGNGLSFAVLGANVITANSATVGNASITNLGANVITANTANLVGAVISGTMTVNNFVATTYSGNGAGMTGVLKVASNLSDLSNVTAARTALGLGSAATQNTSAFQAALGYTPVNKAGDTITGTIIQTGSYVATGTFAVANTDFYTYRSGGTTGIVRLNSAGTRYLYWDGSSYTLAGAHLNTAAGRVWGTGDFSDYPITSMRLAYAGDVSISVVSGADTRDMWAGTVVTGSVYTVTTTTDPYGGGSTSKGPNPTIERRRYVQVYKQSTGWFTISYA
jgi:hypothetical protein